MSKSSPLQRVRRKLSDLLHGEDRWYANHGSFREKEQRGLIRRPHYCYGMLRAADQAKYLGLERIKALEFGVANGAGLENMALLSKLISAETRIDFEIVGFDAAAGLPEVDGYKDHAELWRSGDFTMSDRDALLQRLGSDATVVFGDIRDTIGEFTAALDPSCPVGFVSVDVDIYTATTYALQLFRGPPHNYLPGVSMYFDDTRFFYANEWAGELLAIAEFNAANELRKIGRDRSLPGRRPKPAAAWYESMYVCQILDHECRNEPRTRSSLDIDEHHEFMQANFLY